MIRQVELKDAEAIQAIYNDAVLNTTAIYANNPVTVANREQWIKEKLAANWPLFVFELEGQVVGYATYGVFRDYPGYIHTVEHSIYVNPLFSGRKIATLLMTTLIAEARQQGYHTMIAGIDSSNEASIYLHKKLEFEFSGRLKAVGYKFNRWLDVDFYQLILQENE